MRRSSGLLASLVDRAIHSIHRKATRAFSHEIGALPRVALPVSYSDKMFWRRVFDRRPAFVAYCDKLETKEIFRRFPGRLDIAETLWIGDDPAELPAGLRHPDIVVKMNAGCDHNWFFRHQREDEPAFLAACRGWLARPYGLEQLEWGYGQVPRRLFAERSIAADPHAIDDIKVHLFGGEVFYSMIYRGEKAGRGLSGIFDATGRRLQVTNTVVAKDPGRALPKDYRVPACFGEALQIGRELAAGTDYLRVDFMAFDGKLYGGEITPYPSAGLMTNSDPAVLAAMGRCWDLRKSWFLTTPQSGWRAVYQQRLREHADALGVEPIPILA